jgi:hypothetical protein
MKNKKIIIKNVEDYNKFIKKIKRYRFYRFTFFKCDCNKVFKDISPIIEALNIKKRKNRIEYIYDYCCSYLDNYCENKNFCEFKNNKCLNQYDNNLENGCCRGCRYQSNKGCTTSNLSCKLFYCSKVKEKHNLLTYNDLKILKLLGFRNRIIVKHDYFINRERFLKDLYMESIILYSIKTIFRFRYIKTKNN